MSGCAFPGRFHLLFPTNGWVSCFLLPLVVDAEIGIALSGSVCLIWDLLLISREDLIGGLNASLGQEDSKHLFVKQDPITENDVGELTREKPDNHEHERRDDEGKLAT